MFTESIVESSLGVAIVEDSAMLGELIEESIIEHPLLHVTGRVRNVRDAHELIPWASTALASIDLHLPDGLGVDLGKRVRVSYPRVRILILSDHRRPSLLSGIEARDISNWSYVLKGSIEGRRQLADVIHQSAINSYIDLNIHMSTTNTEIAIGGLSEQQRRILDLTAQGLSNASIASRVGLSEKSVEYHLKQIYVALQLSTDSEANQRVMAAVAYLQRFAPGKYI